MSDLTPATARPKIYVATPSHDHKFFAGYTLSLIKLLSSGLFPLTLAKVGGAGVARARNNMAAEFLKSSCEYYFAIDSDITFEPAHVARLVGHELPVVCGPYALKQHKLQWCTNGLPGYSLDPATGLQRVANAGTGFMCIHRSVFEAMIQEKPEIAYREDLDEARDETRWDFFSMGVTGAGSAEARLREIADLFDAHQPGADLHAAVREIMAREHSPGRYLTEDWYFCHRARALGFDVWMDCTFHVKHEGMISFPLDESAATS